MYYGTSKEIPGILLGMFLLIMMVIVSYFIGVLGFFAFGTVNISTGMLIGGFLGYLYSALNRKRRYDTVLFMIVIGYILGAFMLPLLFPVGALLYNVIMASVYGFVVEILYYLVIIALLLASFIYAKRQDLR